MLIKISSCCWRVSTKTVKLREACRQPTRNLPGGFRWSRDHQWIQSPFIYTTKTIGVKHLARCQFIAHIAPYTLEILAKSEKHGYTSIWKAPPLTLPHWSHTLLKLFLYVSFLLFMSLSVFSRARISFSAFLILASSSSPVLWSSSFSWAACNHTNYLYLHVRFIQKNSTFRVYPSWYCFTLNF